MAHDIAEQIAGLASRVDNLVAQTTGGDCRKLESLQERLEKLTLVVIAEELDASATEYQDALALLQTANDQIGEGDRQIQQISKTIKLIAKAADAVESLAKKAAG
jgi:hypothetical protein